jgi:hypothetical protein
MTAPEQPLNLLPCALVHSHGDSHVTSGGCCRRNAKKGNRCNRERRPHHGESFIIPLLSQRVTHPGIHGFPDATFDYVFTRDLKASPPIVTQTNASDHWPVTREFRLR